MHLGGHCPSCGGGEGNQSCATARCGLDHGGVEYCWQCGEFPCALLNQFAYDEQQGDGGKRIEQCKRWKENET